MKTLPDDQEMEQNDTLKVGSNVRYENTGTIGIIEDIVEDEEGVWALLDTTGLYYRIETLSITEQKAHKEKEYTADRQTTKKALEQQAEMAEAGSLDEVFQATGGG